MKRFATLLLLIYFGINYCSASCGVTASFTPTNTSVCTGEIVNFTNTSSGGVSYIWHLDEFTYSTQTNSLLSFGSAAVYSIELIADDGLGCVDSITIDITVTQAANAGSSNSATFCNTNDSVDLNTYLSGSLTGFWEEETSSGQFNETSGWLEYYQLTESDYLFNYVILGLGACPNDTAQINIEINQEPLLAFNFSNINIDITDSLYVDFDTSGVYPTATYVWDFCDGNLLTNNEHFYYHWPSPGEYCVCVQVNNGNGCVETFCDTSIVAFDQSGLSDESSYLLNIFPNPSNEYINIQFLNNVKIEEIELIDLQGKVLQKFSYAKELKVDLSGYSIGAYIFKFKANGLIESHQIFRY
jgi:hypothetical protein